MKVFDHPNMDNFRCPICGTAEDKPVVLIGIRDTEHNRIIKARQYHLDCIELTEMHDSYGNMALYQFYEEKK